MTDYRAPSAQLRARVALEKHHFHTTHALGQNFLLDEALLSRLLDACDVDSSDCVLEIGPGAGVMTDLLAQRVAKVLAVELDKALAPVLEDVLAMRTNAHVVYADFMKLPLESVIQDAFGDVPYRVVANLPYYITADILLKLVRSKRPPQRIAIMVQKEAAERLLSQPGQKQWCALAAHVRCYGTIEVIEEISPEAFNPPPHVMSCFIQIVQHAIPAVSPMYPALFSRLIDVAFAMRRKTMANNLRAAFGLEPDQVAAILAEAGLPPKVRGEALDLPALCRLSDVLAGYISL